MATIADRIKEALELRGMKQSELSDKTGIGKSSISQYLSGNYDPKQKAIFKMARALRVNEPWLMGFDVAMERTDLSEIHEDEMPFDEIHTLIARNGKNLTTEEKQKIIKTLLSDDE